MAMSRDRWTQSHKRDFGYGELVGEFLALALAAAVTIKSQGGEFCAWPCDNRRSLVR